jgi:N-acetylmuramoyl-L-alanine amidase
MWLDQFGNVWQAQQTDTGHAVWLLAPYPKSLPLDSVSNPISAAAIVSGGTGYATNDTITIANGTVLTVTNQIAGVIQAGGVSVQTAGNWGCQTGSTFAQVSSSGSGTGASFTVTVKTAVAAYGTRLLSVCYTANKAADIQRVSDNGILTVGFVGGVIDVSSMQNFCAGTTCGWSKWYDQGGGGNDAVQATQANQPIVNFTQQWNGLPIVYGNYMTIPSGAAYNYAGFSVYDLVEAHVPNLDTFFSAGASANNSGGYLAFQEPPGQHTFTVERPVSQNPEIVGVSSTGTNSAVYSDNDYEYTCSSGCNGGAGAITGGTVGSSSGIWNLWGSQMFIIWPKALSTSERVAFRASTYKTFNVPPQPRDIIITAGDSRPYGQGSTFGLTYQTQMRSLLKNNAQIFDAGVQSQKLDVPPNSDINNFYTANNGFAGDGLLSANIPHGKNSWVTLWTGFNDNANGVTPSQFAASEATYVSMLHALGMKVAVNVDFTAPVYQSVILANTAGADLVINLNANPVWNTSTYANQSLINSPHPSSAGYGYVASDEANGLNSITYQ